MNGTEHRITVADVVHQHADADQVINLVELATSQHHLLVNRVVLFRPPDHLRLDFIGAEIVVDRVDDLLHELFALRSSVSHQAVDLDIQLGIEHREAQVFELPLDGLDPEPMCQRSVDLEGLPRLPLG